jgi:hypothetical protein
MAIPRGRRFDIPFDTAFAQVWYWWAKLRRIMSIRRARTKLLADRCGKKLIH